MNILVIEDDRETATFVSDGLRREGHTVDALCDGRDGVVQASAKSYDVIVVDRMLPGLDGLSLVKCIRSGGVRSPVLFLTALGGVDDRVEGLEAGGDDYISKPFAFSELLARVRTLLRRRGKTKESEYLKAADLELDLLRRRVNRGGRRIDLTAKEFALLELLLRRQGEVLPRSLIASQVWDMNFDSDTNVIEVAIKRLRQKVDEGFEPKLIRTVRGMGYILDVAE